MAGSWYPADPAALRATVEKLLAAAQPVEYDGRVLAVIAPHAGYNYSGAVAAWSYRQIPKGAFLQVVVLAPSHHGAFRGFSIMKVASYTTPLGEIPLDPELCAKLAAHELHVKADNLHAAEHAIEVQLPFLQTTAGEFHLVPILVGSLEPGDAEKIAAALLENLSPDTLVVVSTDFTHYGPNYGYLPFAENVEENLRKLDMGAVDLILNKDCAGYAAYLAKPAPTICGRNALAVLLRMLPAQAHGRLLKYDTSGRITGDFTNSVSYVSAMFTLGEGTQPAAPPGQVLPAAPHEIKLTTEEKKTLLRIARDAVEGFARSGQVPEASDNRYALTPALKDKAGVFVTLKKRHELRGCVGRMLFSATPAQEFPPLHRIVALMAVEAARDQRFEPVRPEELKEIELEISVLSVATPVRSAENVQVGRQGLALRKEGKSAVFLPQVATEQGWTREQMLENLCLKAGLPADEWRKAGMAFAVFTAEVFDESLLAAGK